jgi:hypothetical protein
MTGTDLCVKKPHKYRSYLNHLVFSGEWLHAIWEFNLSEIPHACKFDCLLSFLFII